MLWKKHKHDTAKSITWYTSWRTKEWRVVVSPNFDHPWLAWLPEKEPPTVFKGSHASVAECMREASRLSKGE